MMKTALLIDNGKLVPETRAMLEGHGWVLVEASTAEAAFQLAKQQRPDVILLNLTTGIVDGRDLAMALKWDPLTCAIPILAFNTEGGSRSTSPGPWATEYVTRSIDPPVLLAKLQQLLMRQQRHQPYVLVVDDEPDLVEIMTQVLDQQGYLSAGAFDGLQALEIVRTVHPDAIVLDLDMPRLNGWQVLERLKRDEALASIRIIILTGVAMSDTDRQACLSRGADAYLFKPCSPDEVVRTLQAVL